MHIRDLHKKGFVCFEKSLKEIHSFAPAFNVQRANLAKTHVKGPYLNYLKRKKGNFLLTGQKIDETLLSASSKTI